jgi:hypothetical protein
VIDEDVTVLGEQLAELHTETLTSVIDEEMREDYQRALDAYERAKAQLRQAIAPADLSAVNLLLDDGRFARACVLARRDGEEPPHRRDACFFNPQHGPGATEVEWAPSGGVPRTVSVCRADANRLANGELPPVRMVKTAAGLVPWHAAGPYLSGVGISTAHVHGTDSVHTMGALADVYIRQSINPPGGQGMGGGITG